MKSPHTTKSASGVPVVKSTGEQQEKALPSHMDGMAPGKKKAGT